MTENDLKQANWVAVNFLEQNQDKIILLECASEHGAKRLLELISANEISLKVSLDKNGHYIIKVYFPNDDIGIGYHSPFTDSNFPQLKWLKNQLITHITCGFRDSEGKLQYLQPFHPLESKIMLN